MTVSKRHHRWAVSAAATAVVIASIAAASPTFAASPSSGDRPKTPGVAPGSQYVALGSSYAAGPGIPPLVDVGCARSELNYPHLVAKELGLNLIDVTCSGATVDNIMSVQQTAGGTKRPLQIDAVDANTALVTVTVGGNDANYILNMYRESCKKDPSPIDAVVGLPGAVKGALCAPADIAASQKLLEGVEDELVAMISAIKARAPKARILLVDYQTVVPTDGATCAATPLDSQQIQYFTKFAKSLAGSTKRAAASQGVQLVRLAKASRDHNVCSDDPWMTGWVFGQDMLSGGVLAYHPNAEGMAAAADLVVEGLTQKRK